MLWTLVFCFQAVLAVDQSLLDSFKVLKEEFLQAQDALGQFENLLQQETGSRPNRKNSVDNFEESQDLEEEYRILDTMNAWNRMSYWTRPEKSSDQRTKAASRQVEKVERMQSNSLRNITIGKTTVKIYKDTKNETIVLSMKTKTDADLTHFQLMIKDYFTYIKLLPGMCGKGLCFVAEKKGDNCLLIVIADMTFVSNFMQLMIHLSHSDSFVLRVDSIRTHDNDTLLTYNFQEFQVHYEDDNQVIIDPEDSHINLRTTINLSSAKEVNSTDIQPYSFYEPGTHNQSEFEYSGTDNDYSLKDAKYQAVVRYGLNPDKPMDGLINFEQNIRIAEDIFLEIRKQYTVFPKGQKDSIYFLNSAIAGQAHHESYYPANLPQAFFIGIFGTPRDISIRKHLKTKISNDFPGFEYLITRYHKGLVGVVLTSYNITHEDAGTYEIRARFVNGLFLIYSFEVHVVNKKIRINSFSKKESFSTNGGVNDEKFIEVTCTASGNPLPRLYFTNHIMSDPSDTSRNIKLENNSTFEIKPSEVTEDSVTRKMIVHKLPESFSYPYEIGCKAINEAQEEFQIIYIDEYDFEVC